MKARPFALVVAGLALWTATAGRAEVKLEVLARLVVPPGNIAVTPEGKVVFSLHQFYEPRSRVMTLGDGGTLAVFPDPAKNAGEGAVVLDSVLGIHADAIGVVWMLDNGMRSAVTPKLVAWDTRADKLGRVIELPRPATVAASFVNDLAVDLKHEAVFIADPAEGQQAALIVVDLKSGGARRILQGHASVVAEDVEIVVDGEPLAIRQGDGAEPVKPRIGVNPIALDAAAEWLYFGPMSGKSLYRAPVAKLLDPALAPADLAGAVEKFADKPVCDGIAIDPAGNIYISDLGANAVGVIGADRKYRVLVSDPRLSWPDSFAFGPKGELCIVSNQLQLSPAFRDGKDGAKRPFLLLAIPDPSADAGSEPVNAAPGPGAAGDVEDLGNSPP